MTNENVLLMPFFDESENFVYGFECGRIWQIIESGECLKKYLIHTENKKQIELMCRTFVLECEIEIYDETWAYLTIKSISNELA
jgi:hypothetical protein